MAARPSWEIWEPSGVSTRLDLYLDGHFRDAARASQAFLSDNPEDAPSRVFPARREEHEKRPPDPGRDGVYIATSK